MAYYGAVPWHGLGTKVPQGLHAAEMIKAAGLDWEVELRPARGAREINHKGEFSRYEVLRMPREARDEDEVLLGRWKPFYFLNFVYSATFELKTRPDRLHDVNEQVDLGMDTAQLVAGYFTCLIKTF